MTNVVFGRDQLKPGMAYFSGTGPEGTTCGDCKFRGYRRKSSAARWDATLQQHVYKTYSVNKCAKFHALTGNNGADISARYPSCKYFEEKDAAMLAVKTATRRD